MVVLVLIIGAVYALPNIYGEDPAVQISGARGASVDLSTLDSVKNTLDTDNIPFQSLALENGTVLVRFKNTDQQIAARDLLNEAYKDEAMSLHLTSHLQHQVG